jgi:YVTN family beta-propeller protein
VSSSRFPNAKSCCATCVLLVAALLALAAAPVALARDAYVANVGSGSVSVVDLGTNAVVGTVGVGEKPRDVAITPDGRFAYVTNEAGGTVSVIDTATRAVVGAIALSVGAEPRGIAISPNGQTAWVADFGDGTVSVIDTATRSVIGTPIEVGKEPDGVAVSPDGTSVLVAQRSGNVAIIGTATRAVVGTVVDAGAPSQIAIGPRGGRGFVTDSGTNSVTAFNPAGGSIVGAPIPVGVQPSGIAIGPSGSFAYAAGFGDGTLTPIDTSTDLAGVQIAGLNGPEGVAVNPTGSRGYVVNSGGGSVTPFDTATNAPLASIPVGSAPSGIAIVPNQGPRASFWVSPVQRRIQRHKLTFHGSASKDPDGTIATYAWDFGDGKHAKGPEATRTHTYRRPGTYTVTLTVTDDEGCSTEFVFTGQTASCNGSVAASATGTLVVADRRGPALRLAGGRRQRIRGRISVFAQCPREACTARAGGVVMVTTMRRGAPVTKKRRLGSSSASLAAGQWARLGVPVPRGTRRAVLKALRSGGAAGAQLRVAATDESGLATTRGRYVELVRAHRRR